MTCKLFGCYNQTSEDYPCCSMDHGLRYKMEKKQIQDAFSVRTNGEYNTFGSEPEGVRKLYTIEMAQYYFE